MAYINHAQCLLPEDVTSSCYVCVGKSQRQSPLITGFVLGIFGTRDQSCTISPLYSTYECVGKGIKYFDSISFLICLDGSDRTAEATTYVAQPVVTRTTEVKDKRVGSKDRLEGLMIFLFLAH